MKVIEITGADVRLDDVVLVAQKKVEVRLAATAREKMASSRQFIMGKIEKGEVIYGVNTGFGAFSSVRISSEEIEQLQKKSDQIPCGRSGCTF